MTLVTFSPTREFESLHNTIQKYFDDFSSLKSPFQNEEFSPRIDDEKKYYREERRFGSFKRTFTIPFEVETEKVNADFNDGVLTIKLDKVQPQVPEEKVIKIK